MTLAQCTYLPPDIVDCPRIFVQVELDPGNPDPWKITINGITEYLPGESRLPLPLISQRFPPSDPEGRAILTYIQKSCREAYLLFASYLEEEVPQLIRTTMMNLLRGVPQTREEEAKHTLTHYFNDLIPAERLAVVRWLGALACYQRPESLFLLSFDRPFWNSPRMTYDAVEINHTDPRAWWPRGWRVGGNAPAQRARFERQAEELAQRVRPPDIRQPIPDIRQPTPDIRQILTDNAIIDGNTYATGAWNLSPRDLETMTRLLSYNPGDMT